MPVGAHVNESNLQAQLLNAAEQAIMATNLTGGIIFWNRAAETLYGWNAVEVLGRDIGTLSIGPAFMKPTRTQLARLRRGECWSGESNARRRDGTAFIARMLNSPILDQQGRLVGIAGAASDVTEQKQIQETNRLLAEAGALLSGATDFEMQVDTLAKLAVPRLADWCAVHVLEADGSLAQVALAIAPTAKLPTARYWLQRDLPGDDAYGLSAVLRTGEPKLVPEVTPELWVAGPHDKSRRGLSPADGIKSYMIVPLIIRPQILGTITFVAAESGRRYDMSALAVAENLANHVALILDKNRLQRQSQRLNAELEQRVEVRTAELRQSEATIRTLFRISKKLNATLEVGRLLDDLAQEAIQIVHGESGFAGLRTADGMTVSKYFRQGQATLFDYTWPAGTDIPGWVLEHKMPYGTSDAANDPVILHDLPINAGVRSVICTPILDSVGEVLGFFNICNKSDGAGFTLDDQEMLMALSPAASIAIQNALAYERRLQAEIELKQSYEQLRELAARLEAVREEERTGLARELHDQLGQALTALKIDLARLTDRLVEKDATLAREARAITAQMDTLVKSVRRIATELRPGLLDTLGLAASIEWQAREFQKRTDVRCVVRVPAEDLRLAQAPSTALFRIFQETLTNVARHAKAQHVSVELEANGGWLTLRVHDDGRGIRSEEFRGRRSLGLLGMRERAELLGGTFDIRGAPGQGTTVTVSIPYVKTDADSPGA